MHPHAPSSKTNKCQLKANLVSSMPLLLGEVRTFQTSFHIVCEASANIV